MAAYSWCLQWNVRGVEEKKEHQWKIESTDGKNSQSIILQINIFIAIVVELPKFQTHWRKQFPYAYVLAGIVVEWLKRTVKLRALVTIQFKVAKIS